MWGDDDIFARWDVAFDGARLRGQCNWRRGCVGQAISVGGSVGGIGNGHCVLCGIVRGAVVDDGEWAVVVDNNGGSGSVTAEKTPRVSIG